MEGLSIVNPQDGSPFDRVAAGAGVRKPRSGLSRKPRFATQTASPFDQEAGAPFSGNSQDSKVVHGESGHSPRHSVEDSTVKHTLTSGERDKGTLPVEDGAQKEINNPTPRMGDRDRTEWKMFQRRERRKEDERPYDRDSTKPSLKTWKDFDGGQDKTSTKSAASPEYERMKKLERPWKEKEPSDRWQKDTGYRDKGELSTSSKSAWQQDRVSYPPRDTVRKDKDDPSWKDRGYRDRGDHGSKDRFHRVRDDVQGGREHVRDRDHDRVRRVPDSWDNSWKSKEGIVRNDSVARHSSQPSQSGFSNNGYRMQKGNGLSSDHSLPRNNRAGLSQSGSAIGEESRSGNASAGGNVYSGSATSSSPVVNERRSIEQSNEKNSAEGRPLTKFKLKVGGVTHTIHSDGRKRLEVTDQHDIRTSRTLLSTGISTKRHSKLALEASKRRQRLILQDLSDDDDKEVTPSVKSKDDSSAPYYSDDLSYSRRDTAKDTNLAVASHQFLSSNKDANYPLQGVRKSSRVPKKRVFDNEDDDGEIEPKRKRKKKIEVDSDEDLYRIEEDEVEGEPIDEDIDEDDDDIEAMDEGKPKGRRRRKKKVETDMVGLDNKRAVAGDRKTVVSNDSRMGVTLTARQRALQSSKEGLADVGPGLIEFPEGLTASAPKKQKEVLTAAERQLKKEEAARKRRQQVEKAAKEIQAVAIQKILCQDSQRKKREGKLQKQREEMEQEKKAAAMAPASNSIRWVLGPNGNVVSFSQDLELPKIFSGPLSYPQEREKCAGPSCTNVYKYRDSKTLLPLCSLQCYRAVQKPSEATFAH